MIWEIDEGRRVVEGLDESGRPDPEYAAALGLRSAPLGRRALASIIEFAMFVLLQLPYWIVALPMLVKAATGAIRLPGLVSHPDFVWMVVATAISAVLTTAFVIVQIVLHGRKGVTLGKAFTGIRSIHVATLERPGMGRALLRALVLWTSFAVPIVGPALFFLSPLLDSEKRGRGWLDTAARTWFVDVRHGLDPYHDKKMRIARKTVSAEPEAVRSELPSLATPADSLAQAYRPGARTSSGVVGVARPQQHDIDPVGVGARAVEEAPGGAAAGAPAGSAPGGYRPGELSGSARPAATAPSVPLPPAPPPARTPPPAAHAPIDEHTIIEPDLDDEIDDRTVRRVEVAQDDEDLDATRERPASRAAVATLSFDSGDRVAITGAALIGRSPAPAAGEAVEHLLPIADSTRSISKTHLLITAAPLAAIDRASTNGSSVVRAGAEHPLEPGMPFALVPGDVVRFGDRTVTIEGAA